MKGIELNNKNCYYVYADLYCFVYKKDYDEAEKYAIMGYEIFGDTRMSYILGMICHKKKDYENAIKYSNEYLNINKCYKSELRSVKNINMLLGNYYEFVDNDYDKAEIYLKKYDTKYKNLCCRKKNLNNVLSKCEIVTENIVKECENDIENIVKECENDIENIVNNKECENDIENIVNNKECEICSNDSNVYKLLYCCRKFVCKKCVIGIINSNSKFNCPFCRKEYKTSYNNIDDDY
jgi:tetratricopeptide (TPR) repeat protein